MVVYYTIWSLRIGQSSATNKMTTRKTKLFLSKVCEKGNQIAQRGMCCASENFCTTLLSSQHVCCYFIIFPSFQKPVVGKVWFRKKIAFAGYTNYGPHHLESTTVSTQILRRRSNFRKWFLDAFVFKFEQSAVIIKMPF